MLQHQLGGSQTFVGLGESADPILTGQHGDGTGLVIVPVGVIQLVGDFLTRAGHAEGVGIHGAVGGGVVGPLPGSLGVAVVGHAVSGGLALGSQDVVHRVMRAVADGEVVLVAVLHDVGLGLHVVVAGQVLQIHIDDHGGAFAGLEHLGHVVVQQLHSRLLNQVLAVILGVGSLTVDLHIGLAGHLTGVGDLHRHMGDLLVGRLGPGHVLDGLVEGRVAQAVAKGIDDFLGIVPLGLGILVDAGAVGLGLGGHVTHDAIPVTGLVVTVADVDAFRLDQVVLEARVSAAGTNAGGILADDVAGIGQLKVTHVAHRRRGHGVAGVDVVQTAGGIGLTGHDIADAVGAVGAGQADVHDGIDLLVRLQFTQLHRGNGGDQHNDLVELLGHEADQLALVGGQRQRIAGANALRHAFDAGLVVSTFAVAAAQHHDRRVAVLLQAVLVGGIGLLQLGGRSLAGIVHEVIGLVAGPAGIGRAQAQGGVDLLHSGVDSQTGSLQAIDHGGAVVGPAGAQG